MQDEFELIQSLLSERVDVEGSHTIEVDAGDDAAVFLPSPSLSIVTACDTMVENVHFTKETMRPFDIGWKLLASNLSDLAAMGGVGKYILLSIAIPPTWSETEMIGIYAGINDLARKEQVRLIGGDTVSTSGELILTLTILGEIPPGKALLRSSAMPGDLVFVTGHLGDAAAGLHILLSQSETYQAAFPVLVEAHKRPRAQLQIGEWLLHSGYRPACDDVSDGLAREAYEIAEASHVKLVIQPEWIPISTACQTYASRIQYNPIEWALNGGEDYQLLGTISPAGWKELQQKAIACGWKVTQIGYVEPGTGTVEMEVSGKRRELQTKGYNHFAK
ncbi:thiamine-phosphate kinase [Hazenella sp. IB182353]|uniref:thiamine-phosphate kinase n=1 Tax=Polycladospora coralii TaxID=2771432 RepID=UPI001747A182|nr:thiamine-phosphate kinase [Polycladospora coralii]MBS7531519.1 thiamine-phosphate kinase [Polycladospora coralii]